MRDRERDSIIVIRDILRTLIEEDGKNASISPKERRVTYHTLDCEVAGHTSLEDPLYDEMISRLEIMSGIRRTQGFYGWKRGKIRILGHDFNVSSYTTPEGTHISLSNEGKSPI